MNIVMATPSFCPRIGGVEKHVLRVSEELVGLGHQVTVLTRRWEGARPEQEHVRGLTVRRVGGGIARAARERRADLLDAADVVHCHDLYSYLRFVAPVWAFAHGPLTARDHASQAPPVFVTFHGYEGYPIPRGARWLRRRLAARAAGTICVGEFICRWYDHPCDAISYGGVDAPRDRVRDPDPDAPALYVGRLAADTSIMGYLEALRRLRQRGHDISLVICGEGPLRDQVVEFAAEHDVDVTLRGWIAEPAAELRDCRFAFVSGYLSIMEAMAYRRLACALYDNPLKRDYLELFPGAANMIIADGPGSLAAALLRHIESPPATRATLDAAEAFARQQTWRRVAALYLDLYRKRGLAA
jgi:glycosyltransferase involved in cell wall biosynthesis